MIEPPNSFSEAWAAEQLGVSPRTLREWRRRGWIGFYRTPGGRISYSAGQVAECRTRMRVEPVNV